MELLKVLLAADEDLDNADIESTTRTIKGVITVNETPTAFTCVMIL